MTPNRRNSRKARSSAIHLIVLQKMIGLTVCCKMYKSISLWCRSWIWSSNSGWSLSTGSKTEKWRKNNGGTEVLWSGLCRPRTKKAAPKKVARAGHGWKTKLQKSGHDSRPQSSSFCRPSKMLASPEASSFASKWRIYGVNVGGKVVQVAIWSRSCVVVGVVSQVVMLWKATLWAMWKLYCGCRIVASLTQLGKKSSPSWRNHPSHFLYLPFFYAIIPSFLDLTRPGGSRIWK